MLKTNKNLALAFALLAATPLSLPSRRRFVLIAVLKSGVMQEQKAAACRQLARVATKEAVPTLASLLGDEKLSHMARYAMEAIPDPSVDDALRDALGKLKGRPLLGVIGISAPPRRQVGRFAGQTARRGRCRHGPGCRAGLGQHWHARGRQGPRCRLDGRVGAINSPSARVFSAVPRRSKPRGKSPVAGDL